MNLKSIISILLGALIGVSTSSSAHDGIFQKVSPVRNLISNQERSGGPTPETKSPARRGIISNGIKEAREYLEELDLGYRIGTVIRKVSKKKSITQKVVTRDVGVAGLHQESGELRTFVFKESFLLDERLRKKEGPPMVIVKDDECRLLWRGGSRFGFRRDLALRCSNKDFTIVGLRMPFRLSSRNITFKQNKNYECLKQETILTGFYIPYSPELNSPELAVKGRAYLEDTILRALEELDDAGLLSRAFGDWKLSELVSLEFLHALVVDEHMDHNEFLEALRTGTLHSLLEKFWVEIALNAREAKRWSVSSAGACCLTQFICPTYARIILEYPEAKLKTSFLEGMQDHVNALKSSVVLFDFDMSRGWNDKTKAICSSSTEALEECWAASYNGGPGRLNKVVAARGSDWQKTQPILKKKRRYFAPRIREETRVYLAKFKAVRDYFLSENPVRTDTPR